MKKFRKLTAVITALCLAGSMMATMSMLNVSAEDTYSITISNEVSGHDYEAYQIFAGDYSEDILSNIVWGSGLDSTQLSNLVTELKSLVLTDSTKPFENVSNYATTDDKSASDVAKVLSGENIKLLDDELTRKFADVVAKYLSTDSSNKTKLVYENNQYKATITDPGYYLVQDETNVQADGYTRYILQVVGNAIANHKNSVPSVMKKVQENTKYTNTTDKDSKMSSVTLNTDDDKGWNDVADYNIGDNVPFRLYGSMPSNIEYYNAYRYIFHDTLDSSLSLNESSITVKIGNDTVKSDCYTIVTANNNGNIKTDETFTIEFKDIKTVKNTSDEAITVNKDTIVIVEYNATLTSSADIGLDGQQNKVYLQYSNNPNWDGDGSTPDNPGGNIPDTPGSDSDTNDTTNDTPEDKVIVFTYELDITKVDGALYEAWENSGKTREELTGYLEDAKFLLYTDKGTTLVDIFQDNTTKEYVVMKGVTEAPTGYTKVDSNNKLVTNTDGKIVIKGLDDGTYYLEETDAPAGYNKLEGYTELEISANTQNDQSWNGTPSDALPNYTDVDNSNATGLKLTIDDIEITYSLTAVDDKYGANGCVEAIIKNNKGSSLPGTGGIGTKLFYVGGGIMVVGAGVFLITKKRMQNNEQ